MYASCVCGVMYKYFIDVLCDTHSPARRIQMIQTILESYVSLVGCAFAI